ncbi:MAG: hypothetical protein ACJ71S_09525 [Acidobacteriaceae bacterium]
MATSIVVQNGGSADQGASVTWENTATVKVHVTGLAGVVANGEFHVDPASNGKSGEKVHGILPNAPVGDHPYTISDGIKDTNPVLHVDSGMPRPKK